MTVAEKSDLIIPSAGNGKRKTLSLFSFRDIAATKIHGDGYIAHEEKIPHKEDSGKAEV